MNACLKVLASVFVVGFAVLATTSTAQATYQVIPGISCGYCRVTGTGGLCGQNAESWVENTGTGSSSAIQVQCPIVYDNVLYSNSIVPNNVEVDVYNAGTGGSYPTANACSMSWDATTGNCGGWTGSVSSGVQHLYPSLTYFNASTYSYYYNEVAVSIPGNTSYFFGIYTSGD